MNVIIVIYTLNIADYRFYNVIKISSANGGRSSPVQQYGPYMFMFIARAMGVCQMRPTNTQPTNRPTAGWLWLLSEQDILTVTLIQRFADLLAHLASYACV